MRYSNSCEAPVKKNSSILGLLQGTLRRLTVVAALLASIACTSDPTVAQSYLTMTGAPTFSAPEPVEQGFVESANGNLHLEFPLGSFPQRGSQGSYKLRVIYDSHIWQISTGSGSTWSRAGGNLTATGWSYSGVTLGSFVEADRAWQGCGADFTWTDRFATSHYFALPSIQTVSSSPGQCPMTGDAFATDSSGYHLYYDYAGYTIKIYAPDGTIVRNAKLSGYDTDAQGHIVIVKDPNGNYLSQANDAKYIHDVFDTVGRIPAVFSQCGAVGGPCFDIANSQADTARSHYVVNYATIAVKTAFGQSGVTEFNGNMTVVQSIVLPDGNSYSFKYDCDSTLNSQVCGSAHGQTAYYGVLTSMTLPTGGTTSYGYTTYSDSYSNKSRWLSWKNGNGSYSYSPQVVTTCSSTQVGCQQKLTVVKPNGGQTVYTFTLDNGSWPTQVQELDASGNTLSTIASTWDFTNACVLLGCHGHNFIRKLSETQTVSTSGGTSLTKKTTYSYDTPQKGNITAIKEWKFYPGTSPTFPSVPDRASYMTYYSAGANIINKPLSVTLCNNSGSDADCPGGGSKVNQTKITYDSYGAGLTTVSGIANHDDTNYGAGNLARGNGTQVQRWVSGSTYLGTQSSFDTTGQLLTNTDPAANQTVLTYTDNFFTNTGDSSMSSFTPPAPTNAYVKTITQGVLTTTFGYYFGSGNRALTTDPNNTTTFNYFFDPLDRPKQTIDPIGWTLAAYSSPNRVDTYVPVGDTSASAGCSSCQHRQANLDSWGRKVNEELVNAPGGAINTDTTYDSSGRVASVSHAYISTSDPSYVFETTSYDALDRTIAVTHPDNQSERTAFGPNVNGLGGVTAQQASTATYGYGYPVISVDETGKQRQEWIDGFGKTIEVDEPSSSTGTPGTAAVTVNGSERSLVLDPCAQHGIGSCPYTVYDSGTVSITVGGYKASASYYSSSTLSSVTSSLVAGLNSSSSPVTASVSGSTITMTARGVGTSTNFTFSTSAVTNDPTDFSGSSFWVTPASGALSGGTGGISASPLVTAYLYDVAGNLKQVSQGLQTRTFSFDGLGRLTSRTTPEAGTENLYYTNAANGLCAGDPNAVCRRTDARGITSTYAYNARSQVTSKSYSSDPGVISYQYDLGGAAAFALGRRTSMTDPSGSETYSYNSMGWITQIQKTIGANTFVSKYQYNAGGQVTQITYPSNRVVQQNVDNIGLLNSIVSGGSTYVSIPEPPSGYDAAMQLLTLTYGNGVTATFGYSPSRQQMTSLGYAKGAQTLFSLNYFYQQDPNNCSTGPSANNGQIVCIKDLVDGGRTLAFTYDALGRLSSAVTNGSTAYPRWGLSESYDRYGNRLSQAVTAGTGPSNSLSFATTSGGGAYTNRPDGYSFDASGNMLNDGSNTLTYDAESRLITSSGASGSGAYTYDGHGFRVKNVSGGTTTVTIYSGSDVIAEYANGAAPASPTNEYIYLGGQKIAMIQSGTLYYFHNDHLSPRFRTDTAGSLRDARGTYPFGELWYSSPSPSWLFTTYHHDNESGNDYALARTYISRFGRFCSADPVMGNPNDPQSWNRYSYVRNDPVNGFDPSGQSFFSWLMRAFFAVISAFSGVPIYFPMPGAGTPPIIDNGPFGGTQIMLNSIYHPQDPSRFIINNWSPAAHDQMIQDALGPCGVGQDQIKMIQKASRDFDSRSQAPSMSYAHSMTNGKAGQSAEEAINQRNQFIVDHVTAAQNAWNKGQTNNALADFGEAIHPVMDSTSPWHTDPQGNPIPWCGLRGCAPLSRRTNVAGHVGAAIEDEMAGGPFGESAGYLSRHPVYQQQANTLIRSAFEIMTGLHLNCK